MASNLHELTSHSGTVTPVHDGNDSDSKDLEKSSHLETSAVSAEYSAIRQSFTVEYEKKILRKIDLWLLPLLILAYLVKNLDGNNVSYVPVIAVGKPTNVYTQLHMTKDQWSNLGTIFTIPFFLFEIPSNLLIKRVTPRLHFVRIMTLWSVATICAAAVKNKEGLYACRFFVGLFEAGLYPGILVQITYWYRPDEMSVRMAVLGMLGSFSGILTALLAYGLEYIDGRGGLAAWRWLFLIEGLIGFVLAVLIYFLLPDFPDTAKFLSPDERAFVIARLPPNAARASDKAFDWAAIKQELKSPLLYGFTGIIFFSNLGATGLSFWLPTIIASFGFTTTQSSQLLNLPPACVSIIFTIYFAWLSDRTYSVPRPIYAIISKVITLGAFIGLTVVTNKPALYALIIIATGASTIWAAISNPWRAQSVKGATHAAFSLAFQNCVGQIPGAFSGQIFRAKYAPHYTIPFVICIVIIFLSLLAVLFTWYYSYELEKETRIVAKKRNEDEKATGKVSSYEIDEFSIGK